MLWYPKAVTSMKIITNFGFVFPAIWIVIAGFTLVKGHKVTCHSTPPSTHKVEPGSKLNLTCLSTSPQVLVWSKNGKPLHDDVISAQTPGSKVRSLVTSIRNASVADSGFYECYVDGGSCHWRLDVFSPPSITLKTPASTEHLIGTYATIFCSASGYPPPAFKWLLNGIEVKNSNSLRESQVVIERTAYESRCKIVYGGIENSGTYTCVANNSRGQDQKSVVIVFRDIQKLDVHTAEYKVFKAGRESVYLRCVATDVAERETKVTWYHKGRQLANHKEHVFNDTMESILRILNTSEEDAGVYWCSVKSYDIEKKKSTRLIQAIEGLPFVSTEHPIARTRVGERLTLFCSVTFPRYDDITTSWTKNGTAVPHSYTSRYDPKDTHKNNSEMLTFSLTIKKFTLDDAGTFVCRVQSVTGTNWTSIDVQIQDQTAQNQVSSVSTSSLVIIFLVAALGSIFAIVAVFTIRYLYRVKSLRLAARYRRPASTQEYSYETFLSFSNHDNEWTTSHLTPLLDKYSFKYCITRKDFEVGKAVIENIADSIYQSRTVIAILSKNFMTSKHCQQELDLALYKSAELDDGSLIVIRIDSIEKSTLPKALRNRTFLDYADTEERKHWERRLLKCLFSHTRNSTT